MPELPDQLRYHAKSFLELYDRATQPIDPNPLEPDINQRGQTQLEATRALVGFGGALTERDHLLAAICRWILQDQK